MTGPLSALWYLIFVLPMFFFTPDAVKGLPLKPAIGAAFGALCHTEGTAKAARDPALPDRPHALSGWRQRLLILGGAFAAGMFGWATLEIGLFRHPAECGGDLRLSGGRTTGPAYGIKDRGADQPGAVGHCSGRDRLNGTGLHPVRLVPLSLDDSGGLFRNGKRKRPISVSAH